VNKKNNLIEKMEQAPVIEISVGACSITLPTEINFNSNKSLDIQYLWKICSLLEENGYDDSKLELTSKKLAILTVAHRKEGKYIYEGENDILNYSLMYDNLDDKTKNKIEELLKSIPYVKIKKVI
jgi:hypothetical protein